MVLTLPALSTSPLIVVDRLAQLLPLLLPRLLWRCFLKLPHSIKWSQLLWHRTQVEQADDVTVAALSPLPRFTWISLYKSNGRHLNGIMGCCNDIEYRRFNIFCFVFVKRTSLYLALSVLLSVNSQPKTLATLIRKLYCLSSEEFELRVYALLSHPHHNDYRIKTTID